MRTADSRSRLSQSLKIWCDGMEITIVEKRWFQVIDRDKNTFGGAAGATDTIRKSEAMKRIIE
jgi:hypothetical protein